MKIKLENREYDFFANGRFLLNYQETFKENLVAALYKMSVEKDPLECAKMIYCGIKEEKPFEEWLDSFETPLFVLNEMDRVFENITRSIQPTVDGKEDSKNEKKTTI